MGKNQLLLTLPLFTLLILAACQPATAVTPSPVDPELQATETAPLPSPAETFTAIPSDTIVPTGTVTPVPLPSVTPSASATAFKVGPYFPKNVDPLTGLTVADPEILDRRPLLIKVSNFPAYGRPQSGLSFADIVFETYIGEGTNRFSALFYGQNPEKVGPVRSARLSDPQIAQMYQSVLAFEGADKRVFVKILQDLTYRAISGSPNTCPALCNTDPNSIVGVFAEPANLTEYGEKNGVYPARKPLDGMLFSSEPPDKDSQSAETVTTRYNDLNIGEWRYDSASGSYLRWESEPQADNTIKLTPLTDKLTGKQLAFNNVLILFARYNEYNPTLHNIELQSNRNGMRAVLYRDGKAFTGYWISPGVEQPMQFFFKDGTPMALKPGNSWMVITGSDSELASSNPGQWLMQFRLP